MVKRFQGKYGFDSKSYFLIKQTVREYFEALILGKSPKIKPEVSSLKELDSIAYY
jgi:hypothetical protein